jgi:hypothetical protein
MIMSSMMRGGAVAVTLAGALLVQGCTSSDPTITAQGTRLLGTSGISTSAVTTGPYSSTAWYAELDAAMTSDNGGE